MVKVLLQILRELRRTRREIRSLREVLVASQLGEDGLLTRDDLAAILRVHPKTVARFEREGVLRPGAVGDRPRYSIGSARSIARKAAAGRLDA